MKYPFRSQRVHRHNAASLLLKRSKMEANARLGRAKVMIAICPCTLHLSLLCPPASSTPLRPASLNGSLCQRHHQHRFDASRIVCASVLIRHGLKLSAPLDQRRKFRRPHHSQSEGLQASTSLTNPRAHLPPPTLLTPDKDAHQRNRLRPSHSGACVTSRGDLAAHSRIVKHPQRRAKPATTVPGRTRIDNYRDPYPPDGFPRSSTHTCCRAHKPSHYVKRHGGRIASCSVWFIGALQTSHLESYGGDGNGRFAKFGCHL